MLNPAAHPPDFRFSSFPRQRESSSPLKRLDTRFHGDDDTQFMSESPDPRASGGTRRRRLLRCTPLSAAQADDITCGVRRHAGPGGFRRPPPDPPYSRP